MLLLLLLLKPVSSNYGGVVNFFLAKLMITFSPVDLLSFEFLSYRLSPSVCLFLSVCLSVCLYIYIYIYICVCVCVCVCTVGGE